VEVDVDVDVVVVGKCDDNRFVTKKQNKQLTVL
jgi:hypothetical protein